MADACKREVEWEELGLNRPICLEKVREYFRYPCYCRFFVSQTRLFSFSVSMFGCGCIVVYIIIW